MLSKRRDGKEKRQRRRGERRTKGGGSTYENWEMNFLVIASSELTSQEG